MPFEGLAPLAKPRPEKKREAEVLRKPRKTSEESPAPRRILPMELPLGDPHRRRDGRIRGHRPYTTAGGKSANVRVKRVGSEVTMVQVWGAHERVAIHRPKTG
jgi:hypothetical protein